MTYYPLSWSEELSSEEAFERVRKAYNLSLKEPDDSSAMHYFLTFISYCEISTQ